MAARKTAIEFLPREDWEKGALGKVLKWALTVGRHIVIFTELIVILAFLSRFKLDRDLTDLGEKIKQQQAIIQTWSKFEKDFRFLGRQLQTIENLKKDQLLAGEVLDELTNCTPIDVYLSDFNVAKEKISLTATALTEKGLGGFLKNLKNSPKFENLSLSQISTGSEKEMGIKFQLKGEFVQK